MAGSFIEDDWEKLELSDFFPEHHVCPTEFESEEPSIVSMSTLVDPAGSLSYPVSIQTMKKKKRKRKKSIQYDSMSLSNDSIEAKYGHIQDQLKYKW